MEFPKGAGQLTRWLLEYDAKYLVTQENRAESITDHEWAAVEETVASVQVVQAQGPWARPCEGPGCNARMNQKS